jgi:putative SOS response-associated peptidase YedK
MRRIGMSLKRDVPQRRAAASSHFQRVSVRRSVMIDIFWDLAQKTLPPLEPPPLKQLRASFNARAETIADKPMFRDAFARHRYIIQASGYYEWLKRPDGRQPYFISAADGGVLGFAGLYDRWKNPETGERIALCTIIVTDANEPDATNSRPHAGGARYGGYQAMAERQDWYQASRAGR